MKRSWLGLGLLAVLLVLGALVTFGIARVHIPLSQQLEQASELALAEQWEEAEALTRDARKGWERNRTFSAAFADHTPMEEIDGHFAQLEVYGRLRDNLGYAALCAEMACQLKAISEAQSLHWRNLF